MSPTKAKTIFNRLLLTERKLCRQQIVYHKTQKISYGISYIYVDYTLQKPIYAIMQAVAITPTMPKRIISKKVSRLNSIIYNILFCKVNAKLKQNQIFEKRLTARATCGAIYVETDMQKSAYIVLLQLHQIFLRLHKRPSRPYT